MTEYNHLNYMLEGYDVPAILVSADYEILANNQLYKDQFGDIDMAIQPKCYEISHGYNRPCDQSGEDCPLRAATDSKHKEKVLHIHQTPNGKEHVDVEMIPIFDENEVLKFFVELLKPIPLASGKADKQEVVGHSSVFTDMLDKVTKVAGTDASVLLLGESGTGKELIARLVHMASKRSDNHMVAFECSGLSESLIESELFGHKKGAFTGAHNDRKGLVEIADGGTLFLDEIGDVSHSTQVKLLRLLETKTFRRVGETELRTSDFRLICATHKDIKSMVDNGDFRLDLYHRINVFPVFIPSLADRNEDIPDLVTHLLRKIDPELAITDSGLRLIMQQSFPGNIRELRNLIVRASILSEGSLVDEAHILSALSLETGETLSTYRDDNEPILNSLKENESAYLEHLLEQSDGDKKAVAKQLGISLRTLYRKLKA
jgi:transcriptional regulator with PAS, ATPase and Fis domain